MKWLLFVLTLFLVLFATRGEAIEVVQLNQLSVDYFKFAPWGRDPLYPSSEMGSELDFNVSISVLKYGFVDTQLHSMTDESQFHVAGLKYRAGVHLGSLLDVYMGHASTHVLDTTLPKKMPYPEQDYAGVTLYLYRR